MIKQKLDVCVADAVEIKHFNDIVFVIVIECTWTVEVHTRRSTLLETDDKLKVNVCSIRW